MLRTPLQIKAITELHQRQIKHGHAIVGKRSRTYRSWEAMLYRTSNPNHEAYDLYGGAGVTVCDRWNPKTGGSFENFLADMGERPEGMTLDRIESTGNYTPQNTRWATKTIQGRNRRRVKLTDQNVVEIRKLCSEGMFQRDVAAKFNVCQQTVSHIVCGDTWLGEAAAA